jgi:protein involved in polysaccharide export with SLBB domain
MLAGCTSIEDKRIQQLLIDKGFGTRAEGVATLENHVAGADRVRFIIDPTIYLQPGAEQLYLLTQEQALSLDGTILVPYVGRLPILGLTERELTALVTEQLQTFFTFPIRLQARITDAGKAIYMFGEVDQQAHYVPLTSADMTLIELVARAPLTKLANLGRVNLIRPDAEHPLTLVVNFREMIVTGNTTYNLRLQPNDIIYIPPTVLGHITRLVEKLLTPLAVAVDTLLGAASIRYSYDVVSGNATYGYRF